VKPDKLNKSPKKTPKEKSAKKMKPDRATPQKLSPNSLITL